MTNKTDDRLTTTIKTLPEDAAFAPYFMRLFEQAERIVAVAYFMTAHDRDVWRGLHPASPDGTRAVRGSSEDTDDQRGAIEVSYYLIYAMPNTAKVRAAFLAPYRPEFSDGAESEEAE